MLVTEPLTVGLLRKAISGLPDDSPVFPKFMDDDVYKAYEPGVEILGIEYGRQDLDGVAILVKLFYLEEGADDDSDS